jgi:phosphatidylglycerol:prolipoprotein diacylglycerol transferase
VTPVEIYKLFLALAVVVGAVAWWLQQRSQPFLAYLAMMCAVTIPGQIFGNLFAALEYPSFSLRDVLTGRYGANILGGIIGGAVVAWFLLKISMLRNRFGKLLQVLDQGACFVPLSLAIGRIGCFASGDGCYGPATSLPWGVTFVHGMVPTTVPVHPTMLYDAIFLFLYFVAINYRYRRKFRDLQPGIPFANFMIFYGFERFFSEFLRLNPKYAGLSQAQWFSIGILITGIVVLFSKQGTGKEIAV